MRVRLPSLLLAIAAIVAVAGTTAPAVAKRAKPTPSPTAPPHVVPGYYLMMDNQLVSPRYADLPSCLKDLNEAKHRMLPGSDRMACVNRTQ